MLRRPLSLIFSLHNTHLISIYGWEREGPLIERENKDKSSIQILHTPI